MSSWVGLFADVWFARDARPIEETARDKRDHPHEQGAGAPPPVRTSRKRSVSRDEAAQVSRAPRTGRVDEEPSNADPEHDGHGVGGVNGGLDGGLDDGLDDGDAPGDTRVAGWERVDLFPARPDRTGSRFDETVALPIDAPDALDTTIRALVLRLRALPELRDLGRRSASYRLHLERTLAQAIGARARLRDGSYGTCMVCSAPISLTLLTVKPWSSACIHCALDI